MVGLSFNVKRKEVIVNSIETVEVLTDIVARQAVLIRKLYSVVEQLNASTSLDHEIKEIQALEIMFGSPE
jgi:hypothetical protein